LNIMRLSPNYLFTDSTTTLLSPTVRSLGPLTMEQTEGAIAGPLPLDQSLLLIGPQFTGLVAATLIWHAIAYILFMRQEIRANSTSHQAPTTGLFFSYIITIVEDFYHSMNSRIRTLKCKGA